MADPTEEPYLAEANGLPAAAELVKSTSRPTSPPSGGSDNDGAERPIREKLKKASIAGLSSHVRSNDCKPKSDDGSTGSSTGEDEKEQNDAMVTDTSSSPRGRSTRKRSFDDLQNESITNIDSAANSNSGRDMGHHKRMRSRDMSPSKRTGVNTRDEKEQVEVLAEEEHDEEARNSPGGAGIMVEASCITAGDAERTGNQSPKKKRSRDQFDKDQTAENDGAEEADIIEGTLEDQEGITEEAVTRTVTNSDKGEPEKKRHRDASQEGDEDGRTVQATKAVEKSSGFANTSAVSPFGSLASPRSPTASKQSPELEASTNAKPRTSSSAFASSGLSAFASSAKSPFGNLGGAKGPGPASGFGSLGTKPTTGFGLSSGFGTVSPFATKSASGFGGLGASGFGGAAGSGFGGFHTGLSSFAPREGPSGVIGSGISSKPIGQVEDEGGREDENDDAESSKTDDDADAKDSRFYEQQMETGEESEETMFSCRAKLFHFEKEWKERGVGTVKLNIHFTVKDDDPEEVPEQKARLIMRTDGVHRVILNSPVFKGMKFGTSEGNEPTGKTLNLTGVENGKPALFLLKIGKEDVVRELYHRILSIHDSLA